MSKHFSADPSSIPDARDSGEVGIRDLIQGAGPRPAVPSEDLARIRSFANEQWREMARTARERSRFGRNTTLLALAASVLLAVALGWWLMPEWAEWGGPAPELVASVELVRGEFFVDDSRVALGSGLSAGAVLETGREASGTALRLVGGHSVRLDKDTRVRLTSGSSFELERGAVYVDSFLAADGAGVEVSTSYGLVKDIGTQFEVRIGGRASTELTVRVREGEVVFERGDVTHAAKAGEELTLRRDSDVVETAPIERHGAAWDWVAPVTPPMDIEGAPIASYLEWVSRETGRELRYSEEALAKSAATETLSGSIEGFTPEQSLSILAGSGFGYQVDTGLLLIKRP